MHYIEFLILLLPVVFGCIFAKRYNFIMGIITVIYIGYLLPFLHNQIDFSHLLFQQTKIPQR